MTKDIGKNILLFMLFFVGETPLFGVRLVVEVVALGHGAVH